MAAAGMQQQWTQQSTQQSYHNNDQLFPQHFNPPATSGYFHGYGGGGANVGVETSGAATVTMVAATEAFTSPASNTSSFSRILNLVNPQPDEV